MKIKRFFLACCALLLLFGMFPVRVSAIGGGAYHPPNITLLCYHAPEDLEAFIELHKEGKDLTAPMEKDSRVGETVFRLYRAGVYGVKAWFGNDEDFQDAALIFKTGGKELRIPIDAEKLTPGGREDVLTYSFKDGELKVGLPSWRTPALFGIRLLILLLLKGLILFLYGYRQLRSWLSFLGVNLLTMGAVNYVVRGWLNVDMANVYPLFFVGLLLVLLFELLSLVVLLSEYVRNKAVSYAVTANLAGFVAIFMMLSFLPV